MDWKHKKGYKIMGDFNGSFMERYAIFLFKTPTGIFWVEPGYLDLMNSSHSAHFLDGKVNERDTDADMQGNKGTDVDIRPRDKADIQEEFDTLAKIRNTTYEKEYKKAKAQMAEMMEDY